MKKFLSILLVLCLSVSMISLQSISAASTDTPTTEPAPNTNYRIRSVYTGTYLTGFDNASSTGQDIGFAVYTETGSYNQVWRMESGSSERYRFRAMTPDTLCYKNYIEHNYSYTTYTSTSIYLPQTNIGSANEFSYIKVPGYDTRFYISVGGNNYHYFKYDNGNISISTSNDFQNASGTELVKYQWEFIPVDETFDVSTYSLSNMGSSKSLIAEQNGGVFDVKPGYVYNPFTPALNYSWKMELQPNGNYRIKAVSSGSNAENKYVERQGDLLTIPNVNTNIAEFELIKYVHYYSTIYLIKSVADGKVLVIESGIVKFVTNGYSPSYSYQSRAKYEWQFFIK